ncbi:MAG: CBS domain-containing protein [Chloroflexaceae bacterium]|nr:CBS domain-containing protein [Chloroflexaceae bacterium]
MTTSEKPSLEQFQRVRIYITQRDMYDNQPIYTTILRILQQEGASGATVLNGVTGFGPRQRGRSSDFVLSSSQPLVIEWIDRASTIKVILPLLHELLQDALIAIDTVYLYQARIRAQGPFKDDVTVGDVMQPELPRVPATLPLADALHLMLEHDLRTLPIVDEQGMLHGVVREAELLRRADLRVPLRLLHLLAPAERNALLAARERQPLEQVMHADPRSIYTGAALPQALITMIEWSYDQLPVVGRDGRLAGLLRSDTILTAAADNYSDNPAEVSTKVQMIMQGMVPTIEQTRPLHEAIQLLLASPLHYLVVVDAEQNVVGDLDDVLVLEQLTPAERSRILTAMQAGPSAPVPIPELPYPLLDLARRACPVLSPHNALLLAAQTLVQQRIACAPVVDQQHRLVGVLTRSGLLRGLAQEQ